MAELFVLFISVDQPSYFLFSAHKDYLRWPNTKRFTRLMANLEAMLEKKLLGEPATSEGAS
jgi:hypothetical protein